MEAIHYWTASTMHQPIKAQQRYLDAILSLTTKNGVSPSTEELMEELEVSSPNSVTEMLNRLERKGLIARENLIGKRKSRSVAVSCLSNDKNLKQNKTNVSRLPPTRLELNCLRKIKTFIEENRYAPSHKDVARLSGSAHSASGYRLVTSLVRKGLITCNFSLHRTIELTRKGFVEIANLEACEDVLPTEDLDFMKQFLALPDLKRANIRRCVTLYLGGA